MSQYYAAQWWRTKEYYREEALHADVGYVVAFLFLLLFLCSSVVYNFISFRVWVERGSWNERWMPFTIYIPHFQKTIYDSVKLVKNDIAHSK